MLRIRAFFLLCLVFLISFPPSRLIANPPADDDASLRATLALQRAMESARHFLLAGDSKKAVEVLEEQLPRVNGNAAYLRLLRDAYRGCIKDMWLANNAAGAKRYLERLCILEPNAGQDASLRPPDMTTKVSPPEPKPGPLSNLPAKFFPNWALNAPKRDAIAAASAVKPTTVRGKVESAPADDDPFSPANMRPKLASADTSARARQLLTKAEDEFARHRFPEARVLFEEAYQADQSSVDNSRDRWAYCMLKQVVDQLNQPGPQQPSLANLQQQVRGAMTMAPLLADEGNRLLREIEQRQTQTASAPAVSARVEHLGRNKEGWQVAETRFFLIFHKQGREQAEHIAAIAEKTRQEMYRKWFASDGVDWSPKCELILHPTGQDYTRETGESAASPGHSRIEKDSTSSRIVKRRMDLRCDNPNMLDSVLPHETTHVVLAGMFDQHHVPRWADEGIAVLTEPTFKVEQHRRNLEKAQQEGLLFDVQELMQLDNYPQPRRISAFYAQSVCLVEFLAEMRGPQELTAFVRDGLRTGYNDALHKHYGMDMSDLQQRWRQRLSNANHVASAP